MTEQDLSGAIQTLIVHAGGRAGERRADDRAGPLRHCIAEAAPESAVQMTEQDLFGAIQTLIVLAGGRAGERFGTAARRPRRRAPCR